MDVVRRHISAVCYWDISNISYVQDLFRAVGGKGTFGNHLLITLYVSGPAYIIWAIRAAASKGMVLTNEPDLYPVFKEYMQAQIGFGDLSENDRFDPLFKSIPVLAAILFSQLIAVAITGWMIICWGAYRHVNDVTKPRSVLAFILACIVLVPVYHGLVFAQRALGVIIF